VGGVAVTSGRGGRSWPSRAVARWSNSGHKASYSPQAVPVHEMRRTEDGAWRGALDAPQRAPVLKALGESYMATVIGGQTDR
jgi:hypothetical protein